MGCRPRGVLSPFAQLGPLQTTDADIREDADTEGLEKAPWSKSEPESPVFGAKQWTTLATLRIRNRCPMEHRGTDLPEWRGIGRAAAAAGCAAACVRALNPFGVSSAGHAAAVTPAAASARQRAGRDPNPQSTLQSTHSGAQDIFSCEPSRCEHDGDSPGGAREVARRNEQGTCRAE